LKFRVLSVAELEGAEAVSWYDDQRPGLGDEFFGEVQQAFERIRAMPRSLSPLEDYSGPHDVRRCRLERFPYLVIFRYRPEEILVVAVSHARRQPLYWLHRLG
jgi:plasmid stabilization system protein ParE